MAGLSRLLAGAWKRARWMAAQWIRCALQMLCFLSIRSNRILIQSHGGLGCFGNPKYISEYLAERGANLEIVWGFLHPDEFAGVPGIRAVWIKSPGWFYYALTASVLIANDDFSRAA